MYRVVIRDLTRAYSQLRMDLNVDDLSECMNDVHRRNIVRRNSPFSNGTSYATKNVVFDEPQRLR